MDFGANKTSIEVSREGAFGGTHFREESSTESHSETFLSIKISTYL